MSFYTQAINDNNIIMPEPVAEEFKNNIYQFSSAKNYQQLKTLSQAAYNPNTGTKTPFSQFKKVAEGINKKYNHIWLRTEQDHAYASTQMAGKWHSFDNDANLKYKTAGDSRVRKSHQALNNIVKAKKDPVWNIIYPPNAWVCRCNVIETNDEESLHTPDIGEAIPKLFRNNSAKENNIFPAQHPYFKDVPKDVLNTARFIQDKERARQEQQKIYSLPLEQQFKTLKTFKNGGAVKQHLNVNTHKEDYQTLKKIALGKAKQGNKIEILPEIHKDDKTIRNSVLPNYTLHPKNPDLKVNEQYYEVEATEKYNNIPKRISAAAKQADNVVVVYDEELKGDTGKLIYKMFREHTNLQTIEIIGNNKTEKHIRDVK